MEFKDRQGENLNRKRLEIVSQSDSVIIADVFSEASNITEYGTPINASALNLLQSEFDDKLDDLRSLISNNGATISVDGQNVAVLDFTSDPQIQLNNKISRNEWLNLVYPIGSIYISANETNPSNLFGGTWSTYASGRMLVGQGESDALYVANQIGGESSHILDKREMPAHNHTCNLSGSGEVSFNVLSGSSGDNLISNGIFLNSKAEKKENAAASGDNQTLNKITLKLERHAHTLFDEGEQKPHNNMPPYIVCYMWKRIA